MLFRSIPCSGTGQDGELRYGAPWPEPRFEILHNLGEHDILLLGPIAVHPTRQGEGLGALLINESLAEARRLGWERVLLVGDAPYYARFGFIKLDGVEMPPPTNPDRVLGLALKKAAWDGVAGRVAKSSS